VLKPGEILKIHFPGGGGFGDPMKRAPEAVKNDIENGYISVQAARDEYGYQD
jgi:N-methylhydantoinase B/oxoprolinase/acetone carboxylase alpha subunit